MIHTLVMQQSSGMRPEVPAGGEVHLWSADLDELPGDVNILSPSERARADRLILGEHRRRFVAARAWSRSILGSCLGLAPCDVPLVTDAYGKPHIRAGINHADLRFNLSHCGPLALMAVTVGRNVGVDLETPLPEHSWPRVAERFLTPEELACVQGLSPKVRALALAEIWTRKESLSKALGTGLTAQVLSWTVGPANRAPLRCGEQLWVVSLHSYDPWAAAVAIQQSS